MLFGDDGIAFETCNKNIWVSTMIFSTEQPAVTLIRLRATVLLT